MIAIDALIEQARSWVGVPFLHQGRTRAGADCLGFIAAMMGELDSPLGLDNLPRSYARQPQTLLLEGLTRLCRPMDLTPGTLALFQFPMTAAPSHAGIYTGPSLIHSDQISGGVREVTFGRPWSTRLKSSWALPLVLYQ